MSRQREVTLADMGLVQVKVVALSFTLEATDELGADLIRQRLDRLPYGHGARQISSETRAMPDGSARWRYTFSVDHP